jgi:hypothetical protein
MLAARIRPSKVKGRRRAVIRRPTSARTAEPSSRRPARLCQHPWMGQGSPSRYGWPLATRASADGPLRSRPRALTGRSHHRQASLIASGGLSLR